ncbi:MAG TPA: hypothetical protein VJG32_04685 [Anaerolineae bacterium]|nr:hypothetical protein [Anaerolineae bacterium]
MCVRYRYDEKKKKRYKTIELVIEETDWAPKVDPLKGATLVRIRVEWEETALRQRVKDAGGRWNPDEKVWELRYDKSVALGLKKRILGAVTL